jgi:hypothetical protein
MLFSGVLLMLGLHAVAAPTSTSPSMSTHASGPLVVELFTSQGCNSCPPADALLGELARRPDVLALALHVTYWNHIGWKDPFSQSEFDRRQQRYAQQPGVRGTYTPQMMINGTVDVVGSQRAAVDHALNQASRPALIILQRRADELILTPQALDKACDCVLTLFGVQSDARTPVGRGENGGKTLQEFQIVRSMTSAGRWNGADKEIRLGLPKTSKEVSQYAVLAQDRHTGKVMAAGRL